MKRNSLLITESERRQIMSLYGLITEGVTTTAKYEGTIVLPPNQIYEKFECKVNFKKGDVEITKVKAKSDKTFTIEAQVEDGGNYGIFVEGSYRIKGSNKDIKFTGELLFSVEVTKLNDVIQPINQNIKIKVQTQLEKQEVTTKAPTTLNVNVYDYRTNEPLKDIDVEIIKRKPDGEDLPRTKSKTDESGNLIIQEKLQVNNTNVVEFLATKTMTINIELIINVEGYKPKKVETKLVAGTDSDISIGLISTKEFKQEIDDFKPGLYVPETYKSNFFTIYGHTKTPLENDKEGALKLARLDAYSQFLKKVRKKYSENDIVKNAVPEGGEIVFKFPPNQDMYYYIVKYKRSELKKFVKSLLKVKDDVEIEDEPKTNKDLVFEDISLNTALLKSKTQGKNIFILVANDGTNMDDVLKVLNEDKVFVKNTNDTKVRIRIEVDTDSEDYGLLRDIIRDNGLSMRSHPRVIYMNKDKKILANYDYYTITTDGKYKL
jgi:hypothetical protein